MEKQPENQPNAAQGNTEARTARPNEARGTMRWSDAAALSLRLLRGTPVINRLNIASLAFATFILVMLGALFYGIQEHIGKILTENPETFQVKVERQDYKMGLRQEMRRRILGLPDVKAVVPVERGKILVEKDNGMRGDYLLRSSVPDDPLFPAHLFACGRGIGQRPSSHSPIEIVLSAETARSLEVRPGEPGKLTLIASRKRQGQDERTAIVGQVVGILKPTVLSDPHAKIILPLEICVRLRLWQDDLIQEFWQALNATAEVQENGYHQVRLFLKDRMSEPQIATLLKKLRTAGQRVERITVRSGIILPDAAPQVAPATDNAGPATSRDHYAVDVDRGPLDARECQSPYFDRPFCAVDPPGPANGMRQRPADGGAQQTLLVTAPPQKRYSQKDIAALKTCSWDIFAAVPQTRDRVTLKAPGQREKAVALIGTSAKMLQTLAPAHFPERSWSYDGRGKIPAVLTAELAATLGLTGRRFKPLSLGLTITRPPRVDYTLRTLRLPCEVQAIVSLPGKEVFVPLRATRFIRGWQRGIAAYDFRTLSFRGVRSLAAECDRFHYIEVYTHDIDAIASIIKRIASTWPHLKIISHLALVQNFHKYKTIVICIFALLTLLTVFGTIVSITCALYADAVRRSRDIAVMRVIGASQTLIRRLYLLPAQMIGAAASGIGFGLALSVILLLNHTGLVYTIQQQIGIHVRVSLLALPWWSCPLTLLVVNCFCFLGSLWPARRAAGRSVAGVLRRMDG